VVEPAGFGIITTKRDSERVNDFGQSALVQRSRQKSP
jgi:hypothetical protein